MCSCLQSLCTVKRAGGGDEGGTEMERESGEFVLCVGGRKKNEACVHACVRGAGSPAHREQ